MASLGTPFFHFKKNEFIFHWKNRNFLIKWSSQTSSYLFFFLTGILVRMLYAQRTRVQRKKLNLCESLVVELVYWLLSVWSVDGTTSSCLSIDRLLQYDGPLPNDRLDLMRPLVCANFTSVDLCKAHWFGAFCSWPCFALLAMYLSIYVARSKDGIWVQYASFAVA